MRPSNFVWYASALLAYALASPVHEGRDHRMRAGSVQGLGADVALSGSIENEGVNVGFRGDDGTLVVNLGEDERSSRVISSSSVVDVGVSTSTTAVRTPSAVFPAFSTLPTARSGSGSNRFTSPIAVTFVTNASSASTTTTTQIASSSDANSTSSQPASATSMSPNPPIKLTLGESPFNHTAFLNTTNRSNQNDAIHKRSPVKPKPTIKAASDISNEVSSIIHAAIPALTGLASITAASGAGCPSASTNKQSNQCSSGVPYCCSPDGSNGHVCESSAVNCQQTVICCNNFNGMQFCMGDMDFNIPITINLNVGGKKKAK